MPAGAHAAIHPVRPRTHCWHHPSDPFLILIVVSLVLVVSSSPAQAQEANNKPAEAQALVNFKSSLENADSMLSDWDASVPPCSGSTGKWRGVLCFNGYVWGLQLENMNLKGKINVDALVPLHLLRTLSFMGNEFEGQMPDWRKLGALKNLYLSNNKFSGQIPADAFRGMTSLKKVYLANNEFTGRLPASLESPKLIELRLDHNQFTGQIPAISSEHLKVFNVSNNQLVGPIPEPLSKVDPNSFSGNTALCGKPLSTTCSASAPAPDVDVDPSLDSPASSMSPSVDGADIKKSSSPAKTIGYIIACVVLGLILLLLLILIVRRGRRNGGSQTPKFGREVSPPSVERPPLPVAVAAVPVPPAGSANPRKPEQPGKLSFVREDRDKFSLQDLMRASAEVLGGGNFGAAYKAVMVDGGSLVVKRFKQMSSVGKEDFHEHMRRLGRLKHPNLLPLVAYLYRKEEKLLVFDFVENGSLESQLQGKRLPDSPPLNWSTRLQIIKGVSKGLLYLHHELPSLSGVHGHLKSSNVLLDKDMNPLLMDYALAPVVNPAQVHELLMVYKSPEFSQHDRISKKSDVWCLGILIIETLTGKSATGQRDLQDWVNSIARARSLDEGMGVNGNGRIQMEKLLQIGIDCCGEELEKRWDLEEAVAQIETVDDHPITNSHVDSEI